MKTPNPDQPIRNTLKHLALASTMGAALYFGASPASAAPPVTTGLKLHLDASQLTGLSDGDTMTTWPDVSGLGNNATASGAPIYKTGVLNGQPVVRFNDASSFTTADLSATFAQPADPNPTAANTVEGGSALDGTYVNTPTRGVAGALVDDGDTAAAFKPSQAMTIPFAAQLNPSGAFTAEIWAKPNGSGTTAIMSSGDFGTTRRGWIIYAIGANWDIRLFTGTGTTYAGFTTPLTLNAWQHLTLVHDGTGGFQVFMNGVAVTPAAVLTNGTASGTTFTPNPGFSYAAALSGYTAVATRWTGTAFANYFDGTADEFAVYGTALSATRIQAHYENGMNAPNPRVQSYDLEIEADMPVAHYKLNEPAVPQVPATVFVATTISNDNAYTLVKANPNVDEWWRYDNGLSYPAVFRGNRLDSYCAMPNSGSHLFAVSSSPSAWEMSIDGIGQGVAGGNYNAGGALMIGNHTQAGRALNGDIAEVLIYSGVLTAEETNAIGYYLEDKYGISSYYTNPDPSVGPESLQAIAGDGQVSLIWRAKSRAVSYNVKRSETPGSGYTIVGTSTEASFTDSSLVNGTPYYYVVSALNPSETSDSSEISATPTGVDATLSTVTGSQPAQRANGADSVTITVTLRNSSNTPIANKDVSLAQTTGSGATITTVTGTTGADGKAVFTATSTTVGPAVFTATDTTDSNLEIVQTAAVDFVDADTPESINVNFTGGTPETASSLSGPAGGLGTIWNQFTGPNSAGVVLDSLGTATPVTITSNFGLPNTFDGAVIALPMLRGSMTNFGKGVDDTNVTINGLEAGGFYNIWMVTLRNNGYGSDGTEQYVGWWSTTNTSSSPSNQLVNAVSPTINTSTFVAGYNYVLFEKVEANGSGQIVFTGVAGELLNGSDNNHRHGLNGLQIEKTTAPVIGIVTDADSTVAASPATVFADGVLTSTVTVTLKDANGTGVPGKEVTLANTGGPQAATINPLTAITTNGAGQAVFIVSSTTPGIEVFTATDVTDTLTLSMTASVEFVEIGVLTDAVKSTVLASPVARLADGSSTSTITVTLRDANGYPVSGNDVTLANSGGLQAATISPAGVVTSDANGQAEFSVSSSTIGAEEFTATDTTDSIVVTQIATVSFIDPNAPELINVNIDNTVQPGLVGPVGGLGTTWNTIGATSATNLLLASGTATTVGFTSSGTGSWGGVNENNTEPTLRLLKRQFVNFNANPPNTQQLVINGLDPAKTYDLYIASAILITSNQCSRGEWFTNNTTSTVGNQTVDNTLDENGSTWVRGNNYVLFEDVVPDGSGNITVDAFAITGAPYDIRLPLNGFQLVESVPAGGFDTWASANGATGQTPQQDHDNDGVANGIEYFMGETGSSFTAMPGLDATNTVSWPASAAYQGTYEVQTSPDLVTWTNVVDPKPTPSGGSLSYTLPTGAPGGKSFVRLLVTPAP